MSRRSSTAVHYFADGNTWVVRGARDPQHALELAVDWWGNDPSDDYELGDCAVDAARPHDQWEQRVDGTPPDPDVVTELGDVLHHLIATARPIAARIVPAQPWDEYKWWLVRLDDTATGRGVFHAYELGR